MNDLLFIPIIGVLGVLSTIVSSKGALYDNRFRWYKMLTLRGRYVTFIGLCILALSVLQFITKTMENSKKEKTQLQQQKLNDSTITSEINKGVDQSRKKLFEDLSKALSKQSLQLDTVTKSLESLKDSAKTVVIKSPIDIPIIIIRDKGITSLQKNDSTIEFTVQLISRQASSRINYINYFCELNYMTGLKEKTKIQNFIIGDFLVPKEESFTQKFELSTHNKLNSVNIAFIGRYTSQENKKEIPFKELYNYNYITKTFVSVNPVETAKFFGLNAIK